MRSHLFTLTGSAGLALVFLAISPAGAITITAPAAAHRASDALDLTEAVDCRDHAHRHKRGHAGLSKGLSVTIAPHRLAALQSSAEHGVTPPA
jgi:hypothetical protein